MSSVKVDVEIHVEEVQFRHNGLDCFYRVWVVTIDYLALSGEMTEISRRCTTEEYAKQWARDRINDII